jgi:hypothetical protein
VKYLFDTDHISILQRRSGPEYADVVQPVYNLDVARTHSFFVGSGRLMVRDNSLPPAKFTPFDAEPALSAIGAEPIGPSVEQ